MSTPLGSSQLFTSKSFYSHTIDQSLRFEDGSPAYLTKSTTAGNRRTFTISCWVKRAKLASQQLLVNTGDDGANQGGLQFLNDDTLNFYSAIGSTYYQLVTTQVFRDASAWYNIVAVYDTENTTQADRIRLYVNGVRITSFATETQPSQNYDSFWNQNSKGISIGVYEPNNSSLPFGGYMAEVNFIDGTALDADSFGETRSGIWIPKDTSGLTFGTNGFRLKFQDSSALGDDTSGNSNDFTASGLATTDVVLDSPTNNWATMNPLDPSVGTSVTLTEGNLKTTGSTSSYSGGVASTFEFESGKWYWEVYINNEVSAGSNYYSFVGAATGDNNEVHADSSSNVPTIHTNGWSWEGDGTINLTGTGTKAVSSVSAPSAGDVLGFAMDLDNGNVYFYLNGTAQNSGSAVITGVTGLKTNPMAGVYNSSAVTFNFGQDSSFAGGKTSGSAGATDSNSKGNFYYTPPSGYLAICSANLPDPAIDPAVDQTPADHFNTVLYTGDDASSKAITGVGFQPDWLWIKSRTTTDGHVLYDSVRGVSAGYLISNGTDAEENSYTLLNSLDSDGFNVSHDGGDNTNESGTNYVAWNWLAGGSAVSNSNGTITSSVSANTKAGFSIVSYTGNGTAGATVGHGLANPPEFFITKRRSQTDPWQTYVASLGATKRLELDAISGAITSTASFNDTEPNSSVFTLGSGGYGNASSATYIAYCFHSVDGYSKIGTYSANNSSSGPFVFLGFRPAFLWIKATNRTSHWIMQDNKRPGYNQTSIALFSNLNNSESTDRHVDFLSNGFKLRLTALDPNTNGADYIYIAFSEQPFKYSNSR